MLAAALLGCLLPDFALSEITATEVFALDSGRKLELEVGEVYVPENRNVAASRDIKIAYLRSLAADGSNTTPTFILPGGPGSSYSHRLEGAGRSQRNTVELIDFYRQRGDVILVDLRGVSRSTPNTLCDGAPNKWQLIDSQDKFNAVLAESAAACRQKLIDEGFDIAGYNVMEAAADVIDIADSLGYDKFRLHGTSFGSHWSMTVMRYHSERVERAVISGVESYDHTYDDPQGLRRAAELLSAMATEAWQQGNRFDDPLTALDALMANAIEDPDSAHGLAPYLVSTFAINGWNFGLTSRARLPGWPAAAAELVDGDVWLEKQFLRFLGAWFAVPSGWKPAAEGLFDCSSGLSNERRARLTARYDPLFSPGALGYYDTICPAWAVPTLPDDFRAGEQVNVPVLFVHGDVDFATPLSNAIENLALFPDSHLLVIENGSHSAFLESLRLDDSMESVVLDWIDGKAPEVQRIHLPPLEFDKVQ